MVSSITVDQKDNNSNPAAETLTCKQIDNLAWLVEDMEVVEFNNAKVNYSMAHEESVQILADAGIDISTNEPSGGWAKEFNDNEAEVVMIEAEEVQGFTESSRLNVTAIRNQQFKDNMLLEDFSDMGSLFPNIASIGNEAFKNCEKLTGITLPKRLASIGDEAFKNTGITVVNIDARTPPALGTDVFDGDIDAINVPIGTKGTYQSATGWSNLRNIIKEQPWGENYLMAVFHFNTAGSHKINDKTNGEVNRIWLYDDSQGWTLIWSYGTSGGVNYTFGAAGDYMLKYELQIVDNLDQTIDGTTFKFLASGVLGNEYTAGNAVDDVVSVYLPDIEDMDNPPTGIRGATTSNKMQYLITKPGFKCFYKFNNFYNLREVNWPYVEYLIGDTFTEESSKNTYITEVILPSIRMLNGEKDYGNKMFCQTENLSNIYLGKDLAIITRGGWWKGLERLTTVVILAQTPPDVPNAGATSFENTPMRSSNDGFLYVPDRSVAAYSSNSFWRNFNIKPCSDLPLEDKRIGFGLDENGHEIRNWSGR